MKVVRRSQTSHDVTFTIDDLRMIAGAPSHASVRIFDDAGEPLDWDASPERITVEWSDAAEIVEMPEMVDP